MSGKFLHSGTTVYELIKGKFLHSGTTVYELTKGKFLHSGTTVYTIDFETPTMKDILKYAEFIAVAGVNSGTRSRVSVNLSGKVGTFFAFSIHNGLCGIHRLTCTGTSVSKSNSYVYGKTSTNGGGIYINGTTVYCASGDTGPTSGNTTYGSTLAIVQFNSVTPDQAESIIAAYCQSTSGSGNMNGIGRNSDSADTIRLDANYISDKIIIAAVSNQIAFSYMSASKVKTVIKYTGSNASGGLINLPQSSYLYLTVSYTGSTSQDTFYGGSIIAWG